MIFVKISFLGMLLKVLNRTPWPFVCAGLYAFGLLTGGLMFDVALGGDWLHSAVIPFFQALLESALYFWLLVQLDGTAAYWGVMIVGGFLLLIF